MPGFSERGFKYSGGSLKQGAGLEVVYIGCFAQIIDIEELATIFS